MKNNFVATVFAIVFSAFLLSACRAPEPVRKEKPYTPALEFVTMNGSSISKDSVFTFSSMTSDPRNLNSLLEFAFAQKYKVISSVANRNVTTEKTNANTRITENNVISTKATHTVRVSYSASNQCGGWGCQESTERFTAQIIRISDGKIEGVIRRHPESAYYFHEGRASELFEEVLKAMP